MPLASCNPGEPLGSWHQGRSELAKRQEPYDASVSRRLASTAADQPPSGVTLSSAHTNRQIGEKRTGAAPNSAATVGFTGWPIVTSVRRFEMDGTVLHHLQRLRTFRVTTSLIPTLFVAALFGVGISVFGGQPVMGWAIGGTIAVFALAMAPLNAKMPSKDANWVEVGPTGIAACTNNKVTWLPREELDRALWVNFRFPQKLGIHPTVIVLGRRPGSFVRIHAGVLTQASLDQALTLAEIPIERVPGVFSPVEFNRQFTAYTDSTERRLPALRAGLTTVAVVLVIGVSAIAVAIGLYFLNH